MFINKNLKETAFNYCVQWSDVGDQKIDCSIISIGAMSHTINGLHYKEWLPLNGMHRVLDTFKNSAVNAVFPVRPIVELPTYVFQILRED